MISSVRQYCVLSARRFSAFVRSRRGKAFIGGAFVVALSFYLVALRPPADFPTGTVVTVASGDSLAQVTLKLEEQRVVTSAAWLQFFVILLGGEHGVYAGDYYLPKKRTTFETAYALSRGLYDIDTVAVLIPEGAASYEISVLLEKQLQNFNAEAFLRVAEKREGYLFPDTYFFVPTVNYAVVLEALQQNFDAKILPLEPQIEASGYTLHEALVMASILEKEARTMESRRTIAGILWKRIELGMPLQVDAVFGYINGLPTFHPSLADLKVVSPYNTYTHKGLPPGPISNPGIDAIVAAITPIPTPYLFYLTDKNGIMRYATTFEGHKANRSKYLD